MLYPAPDYLDDVDDYRRFVRWLHATILITVGLVSFGVLMSSPIQWSRLVPPAITAGLVLICEFWVRRNPRLGVMILTVGVWLMATGTIVAYAGVHSSTILIYPFLIGLAGWVLGSRWLWSLTAACVAVLLVLGLGETMGWYQPTPRSSTAVAIMSNVGLIFVSAYLTYSAHRAVLRSHDRAVVLSREISEQNAALAERERELSLLMRNVPVAIASYDLQRRVVRCNERYAANFNRSPEELVGKRLEEFTTLPLRSEFGDFWEKAWQGEPQHYRRAMRDAQGGVTAWLDTRITPGMRDGQVIGTYVVSVDVTSLVQAETDIRFMNADLERKVQERGAELARAQERLYASREELVRSESKATLSTLVAGVSHEMASPIGNARLLAGSFLDAADKLEEGLESGRLTRSGLQSIQSSLREAGQLLSGNLERAQVLLGQFRQVSADQASEQRRNFDLAEALSEVLASLAPTLRQHRHEVLLEVPPGITMQSYPGPLGQVIINLINNAYLHAFEGMDQGQVKITALVTDDPAWVCLSVSDNGRGMDEDVVRQLFEPFFSTRVGHGGTGLGMSIVDSLVHRVLGGSLSVQSSPGKGARFDMRLPLEGPQRQQAPPA